MPAPLESPAASESARQPGEAPSGHPPRRRRERSTAPARSPAPAGEAPADAAPDAEAPAQAHGSTDEDLDELAARAVALRDADRLGEARAVHADLLARLVDAPGDAPRRVEALVEAATTERLAGHHTSAATLADRAIGIAATSGTDPARATALRAHVDLLLGNVDRARAEAETGLAADPSSRDHRVAAEWAHVLGLAELLAGNAGCASDHLLRARRAATARGSSVPVSHRLDADLVEALVGAGRLDEARTILADLRRDTAASRHPWSIAAAARAHALVRIAEGRPAEALGALQAAAATIESLPFRLERARCLLAWGTALRLAGRRNASRAALTPALEAVAALPSPPWEARVRAELARLRTIDGGA